MKKIKDDDQALMDFQEVYAILRNKCQGTKSARKALKIVQEVTGLSKERVVAVFKIINKKSDG